MTFNKISLLTVEDSTVSNINIQYVEKIGSTAARAANDIFYHLGTNLGQATWSNPSLSPYLTITSNNTPTSGALTNLTNTTLTTTQINTPTLPLEITFQFLTGFQVDINAFRYQYSTSPSYALDTFKWQGSNDGTTWVDLYSANRLDEENGTISTWYYEPFLDNRSEYYSYLRLFITELDAGAIFNLTGLEIYGRIRNLTTGIAGFKTPGDSFGNLLNVDVVNPRTSREIIYDQSNAVWESRVNQPWTVKSLVMSEDLTLTRDDLRNPTLYVLSPNGVNRDVFLPLPELNDAIKFRNLDGLFNINIYEQGNPTPVVLSNTGKLQYEYVYDGTEFHVLG